MKILLINDKGFESGGTQVYTFELKRSLEKMGHTVKVFSSNLNPEKKHLNDYEFNSFDSNIFLNKLIGFIYNPSAYSKLKEALIQFDPDIVHLNFIFSQTSASILLLLKEIPTVMTLHGSTLICPVDRVDSKGRLCHSRFGDLKCINCLKFAYPYQVLKFNIYKKWSKNINKFIAIANYIKKDFEGNNFTKKDNICLILNKINLLKFSKIYRYNNLLYVGRLSKEKGVEYLIKSIPKVMKEFPKVKLGIAGWGDEEENLKKLVQDLGLDNSIKFLGEISHNIIEKEYKRSSIVIVPSVWPEPFGLIGPEAMSVGRPIIATNVGGIPEWLDDGRTGLLVPPKDSDAIAEKVIYLLKRPKLMQKMGISGRKRVEKEFNIEDYAKEVENVYKKIIQESKRKR